VKGDHSAATLAQLLGAADDPNFEFVLEPDGDGVSPAVEDAAPNDGDGNNDGVKDSFQDNVTSTPAAVGGGYVTVAAPAGTTVTAVTTTDASALSPPVPLPSGIVGFTITGVSTTAPVQVQTYWPGTAPTAYYKYQDGQWFNFTANATFNGNVVTLSLVDGGDGDADGVVNHEITDPGGVANAPPPFPFSGFFSPVNNQPILNQVKAGSAVPVKFALGGNRGLSIFASGYPKSQTVECNAHADVDGIESTVSANSSGLQYDAATGTYTYVWKTDKAWAKTCRQLVLKLTDGTVHRADFKLT
jgi:hypothetical protein